MFNQTKVNEFSLLTFKVQFRENWGWRSSEEVGLMAFPLIFLHCEVLQSSPPCSLQSSVASLGLGVAKRPLWSPSLAGGGGGEAGTGGRHS